MRDPEWVQIGRKIREARKRRAMSQRILAERVDIHRTTLVHLEQGDYGVSNRTLRVIASELQVQPEELKADCRTV